jgi:hypothetical protein
MNVYEIVKSYLANNGYDGLACRWCGCYLEDNGLMPCDQPDPECVPGYADVATEDDAEFEPGEPLIRPGRRP